MDIVKKEFVSCHYCFTYYCSKLCQKQHSALHKNKCVYLKAIRNTISIRKQNPIVGFSIHHAKWESKTWPFDSLLAYAILSSLKSEKGLQTKV